MLYKRDRYQFFSLVKGANTTYNKSIEFCNKKKLQVVVLVRPIHLYHLSCQNADFFVSINQSYQV